MICAFLFVSFLSIAATATTTGTPIDHDHEQGCVVSEAPATATLKSQSPTLPIVNLLSPFFVAVHNETFLPFTSWEWVPT